MTHCYCALFFVLRLSELHTVPPLLDVTAVLSQFNTKVPCDYFMTYQWQIFSLYVYWTVHHLDSWIKRDQLDVTCYTISLFNAQRVSDINTSILRDLRLICYFMSCIALVRCVLVLRWCYVVVVWYPYAGWSTTGLFSASACIRIPHHHSQTTT